MAEASPTTPMPELRIGDRVDGYRVTDRIGNGGMATVYEVKHEKTEHLAALKVPQAGLEQALVDRFLAEATVHFQLVQRPHIVAPLSFGTLPDGRPYLVMQLVTGQTLAEWLGDRFVRTGSARLERAEALRFGIQLAEGLAEAHGLNPPVIHRDLKPANIFVETRTVVVSGKDVPNLLIGDFGLAWRRGGEALHSGTPEYVSPEQAMNLEPTVQSDLYTLGVILYELLEGCLPITGADVIELVDAHRRDPPRPLAGDHPAVLADLVMSLLEKHPEERPATARQVASRLTAVLDEIEGRRESTQVNFDLNAYQAARPTDQLPPVAQRAAASKDEQDRDRNGLAAQEATVRRPFRSLWLGLVILAAFIAFLIVRPDRPAPRPETPVPGVPPPPEPAVPAPPAPLAVVPAVPPAQVDDLAPIQPNPPVVPVKPPTARPVPKEIDCTPDERWRKIVTNDLNEVRDLVAAKSGLQQYAAFEQTQVAILERASRAVTPEQCASVQAEVDRVVRKYIPR